MADSRFKFRFWGRFGEWDEENDCEKFVMMYGDRFAFENDEPINDLFDFSNSETICMQFTGLKDKNGKGSCIYEGDFVDSQGNIKGNLYENPEMVKDSTYLLIQGFGTKDWLTTYTKAVERGCNDSE